MLLNLDDYEGVARKRLPRPLFGYVSGASETNSAKRDNRDVFREYRLVPRVLQGVEGRSMDTALFGQSWSVPFGIAPMGIAALLARDGDRVMARAAARANLPYLLSGSSLTPLEEIIRANPDAWFQAYLPGEKDRIRGLLDRVRKAGFGTLVLTADTAVLANRENNLRAGFSTPLRPGPRMLWDYGLRPRWLLSTFLASLMKNGIPHFENSYATRGAPIISKQAMRDFGRKDNLSWEHVKLIRDAWKGRLVIKGLLSPLDVGVARDLGCDGVILSNHGGRQLDYAISGVRALRDALPEKGTMALMVDGGIRRGTDVIKALGLGAEFVFVGRPFIYAASVGGARGLDNAIDILKAELLRDLGLMGLRSTKEISREQIQQCQPALNPMNEMEAFQAT